MTPAAPGTAPGGARPACAQCLDTGFVIAASDGAVPCPNGCKLPPLPPKWAAEAPGGAQEAATPLALAPAAAPVARLLEQLSADAVELHAEMADAMEEGAKAHGFNLRGQEHATRRIADVVRRDLAPAWDALTAENASLRKHAQSLAEDLDDAAEHITEWRREAERLRAALESMTHQRDALVRAHYGKEPRDHVF